MAADLTTEIFKGSKDEIEQLKEIHRMMQTCKANNGHRKDMLGKVIIKIYFNQIDIEPAFYPGIKSIKANANKF